jgi:hypothetical protein
MAGRALQRVCMPCGRGCHGCRGDDCYDTVEDDVTMELYIRMVAMFVNFSPSLMSHSQGAAEYSKPRFASQTAVMFARPTDRYRPNLGRRNTVTAS